MNAAVRAQPVREVVAGVRQFQPSGGEVETAGQCRDEHGTVVVAREFAVEEGHHLVEGARERRNHTE